MNPTLRLLSSTGRHLASILALALLALAGNYFHLPLLFGLDFVFGSIAVMLAVILLGTLPAVVVASVGGLYTLVLWGTPYPMVIFVIEALVVSLVYRRWVHNVVLADLLYWLVMGIPLIWIFYRGIIGMDWEPTAMIALKQGVNALFNTLIASLLVMFWLLLRRGEQAPRKDGLSLSNILFHAMLPVTLLAGTTPILYESYTQRGEQELFMAERLNDRAVELAQRLKTDYQQGRERYDYHLARVQSREDLTLAIVSADGQVLASRGDLSVMRDDQEGSIEASSHELLIWLPGGSMSAVGRWKQGFYFLAVPVEGDPGIDRVYAQMSTAPVVQALEKQRVKLFALLAAIIALATLVSFVVSQAISRPLRKLNLASTELGAEIAAGRPPVWPTSQIFEYGGLAMTLSDMSRQLSISFYQQAQAKTKLEFLIQERTRELANTADQLQAVLTAASEFAIVVTDTNGLITLFNPGAEKMTGYTAEELIGKQTPARFHLPEEITARAAELSRAYDQSIEGFKAFVEMVDREGAETREWTFVQKNGLHIPVSLTVTPQIDDEGNTIGYLGIAVDISERKAMQTALEEERDLFSSGPVFTIIWEATEHWPVLYVSKNITEILSYTPAEMCASEFRYAELIHPDDIQRIVAEVERNIQQHIDTYEQSYRLRLKDGSYKWFYDFTKLVRDERGQVVTIRGYMFDQSHLKRIEMELEEQAQHTQTILDNMVDGIITIDDVGIIGSFNPAAESIFGYTSAEVLGRNVSMLMPNPHQQAHDSYLCNYRATGVARIIGIGREVEGQRKDGSLFPMDLAISEISRQGQPLFVGMVRDITERKRMERMKSEFVSTVSHELRTPLTSISGALGLMVGGALGELPVQAQQMLAIAHKNSQRLTHLINDLLDMEKITAGKLHFEMQVQPLMPLIEQALEANLAYGAERQVSLVLTSQAPGVLVRVDAQRLMQVLANLLSNAIKFSPEGAVVNVSIETRANKALISVADNGPGIPDSFRESVFQKFSQADASDIRQKGGTGLGLAITRELVERMSGSIGFDSVEGDGATFWFELPLASYHEAAASGDALTITNLHAPHILVVEDEPDIAQLLATMLSRAGYRVDIAASGAEALDALQHGEYDLVSLDLMLPGISGLEVIRQIRQRPQTADLPVVVVSAKMEEGRLAINGDFSGIDWLSKPIHQQHLLRVVERQLASTSELEPRVLHVEDDADLHQVIRTMVGKRFDFELATTLEEARARLMLERFDVVILDVGLPDGSGWDLLPIIRTQQPDARVIILSGTDMTAEEAHKVEAVLLKSKVSSRELLDAISVRIQSFKSKGEPV